MPYVADRNLYTDESKTLLLEEGDPRTYWQLVAAGGTLSDEDAQRFGLVSTSEKSASVESVALEQSIGSETVEFPASSPRADSKSVRGPLSESTTNSKSRSKRARAPRKSKS